MKKSDLKQGMVLKVIEGDREGLVKIEENANGELALSGKITWFPLNDLDEDLKGASTTVIEVYGLCKWNNTAYTLSTKGRELLWKRDEVDWNKVQIGAKVLVSDYKDRLDEYGDSDYFMFIRKNKNETFKVIAKDGSIGDFKYCKLAGEPNKVTIEELENKYDNECCDNCHICKYEKLNYCAFAWLLDNYNITRK